MTAEAPQPDMPVIAHPEELNYDLARRAHEGTSFTPDKRARAEQQAFADDVNGFYAEMIAICTTDGQRALLDAEIARYKQNYLDRYSAMLQSQSRCVSTMIAGPANFPTRRMHKYGTWADNKRDAFLEWRNRARPAVKQAILDARTPEEKASDQWLALEKELSRSLIAIREIDEGNSPFTRSAFVNSIVGKVERLAEGGEVEIVDKALALIAAYNDQHKKPAITKQYKFWTFTDIAESKASALASPKADELLYKSDHVQVVVNQRTDRVQIVFDDIPPPEMRQKMKSSGWNWSRTEGAWQRKITENAKYSAKQIIGF
jgi:hypothetical protein